MSSHVDILMVEDNPSDAELAIVALREHRLADHLHHVEDGQEALDFFFGHDGGNCRPRVVLLDLKLPKVAGLEVLRQLRADERTRTIPVVILTSSREDRDLTRAYELGANSYIVKPVGFEHFASVVSDLGIYWLIRNEPLQPLQ